MKQLGLGIIVAVGLTLPAKAAEVVEPIKPPDGIYVLNVAKSTFHGPVVKAEMLSQTGDTFTATGFGANGQPFTIVFPGIADGKPHPVTGSPLYDTQTVTQIDPYTNAVSRSKDGKVVQTGVNIFNPTTNTTTSTLAATDGRFYHVFVFEKQ
jgi:hypothetical protein